MIVAKAPQKSTVSCVDNKKQAASVHRDMLSRPVSHGVLYERLEQATKRVSHKTPTGGKQGMTTIASMDDDDEKNKDADRPPLSLSSRAFFKRKAPHNNMLCQSATFAYSDSIDVFSCINIGILRPY